MSLALDRRRAFGKRLPEAHLLVPDVSLPTVEECAADYQARLDALLRQHAPDGPHLSTLSLAPDGSVTHLTLTLTLTPILTLTLSE